MRNSALKITLNLKLIFDYYCSINKERKSVIRLAFYIVCNLKIVVVAFAAGAGVPAGAADGDFFKLAVATLIVVSACAYVTSDIAIEIFHLIIPPSLLCARIRAFIQSN